MSNTYQDLADAVVILGQHADIAFPDDVQVVSHISLPRNDCALLDSHGAHKYGEAGQVLRREFLERLNLREEE